MHMLWHLLCTTTAASHAQQYLDHRKTAATGVPHWHDAPKPQLPSELEPPFTWTLVSGRTEH